MIRKAVLIAAEQVVTVNKMVCDEDSSEHRCNGIGKVESALHLPDFTFCDHLISPTSAT